MVKQKYIGFLILSFLFGICADILEIYSVAIILGMLGASLFLYHSIKITSGFNSVLTIFVFFFFIYTFSVPLSILLGFEYNFFDLTEFYLQEYLLQAYLCYLGMITGVILYQKSISSALTTAVSLNVNSRVIKIDPRLLIKLGLLLGVLSSMMEVINVIRAGGLSSLYAGKALYQESMGNVSFTLPSRYLCDLAAAIWGMGIALKGRMKLIDIVFFLLSISLLLAISLTAGQRGPLLGWIMILFVSTTYFINIKTVSIKIASGVVIVYLLMSMIYNYRSSISYYLSTGDISLYNSSSNSERIEKNLNPANNEFGAAFGNFNIYKRATQNKDEDFYWGSSYLKGLVVIIPGFLYPGEKPKQITYEFRDKYFAVLAERSRISGTGFSSLLEAYMNFGYIGSVLLFLILGRFLVFLEANRMRKTTTMLFVVVYLTILPIAQSYHRGSFGSAISEFLYKILFFIVILFLVGKLKMLTGRLPRSVQAVNG